MRKTILLTLLCLAFSIGSPLLAAQATPAVDDLLAKLPAPDTAAGQQVNLDLVKLGADGIKQIAARLVPDGGGDDSKARFALNGLAYHVGRPGADAERRMYAAALIDVLASNPPPLVETFLISLLQLAGKEESVAPLGRFLDDPKLYEPAIRALVGINTPAVAPLLGQALAAGKDFNRNSLISALGDLRATDAVDTIQPYAASEDVATRRVALKALANIASPKSADAMAKAAQAQGTFERAHATSLYLQYAQRLADSGNNAQCVAICQNLLASRTTPADQNVVCSTLAILTQAAGQDALPDLLKAVDNSNKAVRFAAMRLIQPMAGDAVTAKLTAKLATADPERRAEIVSQLGYRTDAAAWSAVVAALKDTDKPVRLAAIVAVTHPANDKALAALLDTLTLSADADQTKAIQNSLEQMPGQAAMATLAAALTKSPAPARVALLQVLATRHATAQVEPVFTATADTDPAVRLAALKALSTVAQPAFLPRLTDLLLKTSDTGEQAQALQSAIAISQRIPETGQRAQSLLDAMARATGGKRIAILKSLSQLAGPQALSAVVKETSAADPQTIDAAIRTLADWKDSAAAPALLTIAQTSQTQSQQVLALRGYLRLAALPAQRPATQTITMYKNALSAAKRPDEKRIALGGLSTFRNVAALQVVADYLEDDTLGAEAAVAAMKIVLPGKPSDLPLKGDAVTVIVRKIADSGKDTAAKAQAVKYLGDAPTTKPNP